jgi:lactoylglutathione lyase
MHITHLAIWVKDLTAMKNFYEKHFGAKAGMLYRNEKKGFSSYFLSFDNGCRLELMHKESMQPIISNDSTQETFGLAHLAIAVGSEEGVNLLTEQLRAAGVKIIGEPRWTGDGYYESVGLDIENNIIEITI